MGKMFPASAKPMVYRNPSFDLLKVVAMVYVIFGWHLDDYAHDILATTIGRTLAIGALGVFVFVSGFTLTNSAGEVTSFSDVRRFINKRLIRIYPLYFSSLVLFFITSEISGKQFYSGLFLLNTILNIQIKTLWFVTMIFLFYMLLPLIVYRFSVVRILVITSIFLLVCIILNITLDLMDIRLAYYFPLFILGVFCARSETVFQLLKGWFVVIVSISALALVTYLFGVIKDPWFKHLYVPACLIFSLPPLIALAEKFTVHVNAKLIRKLSYVSFGMYLYHRFVFWVLLHIYKPETDLKLVAYLFLTGFPLLYLLSFQIQSGYDSLLEKLHLMPENNRSSTQGGTNG
ncbi:MAG: acyltransferase family protein [Proteobacteria bacterium]|nr:acyltransferase family protein [Pseudomonadota bacterium]MBU1736511.1 acyltransferase family protein [Pseudomonadota bacterium]